MLGVLTIKYNQLYVIVRSGNTWVTPFLHYLLNICDRNLLVAFNFNSSSQIILLREYGESVMRQLCNIHVCELQGRILAKYLCDIRKCVVSTNLV